MHDPADLVARDATHHPIDRSRRQTRALRSDEQAAPPISATLPTAGRRCGAGLAGEVGKLRALTEVAESTEKRLTAELVEQRARVVELEAREPKLAAAGPLRAWRLARARRST